MSPSISSLNAALFRAAQSHGPEAVKRLIAGRSPCPSLGVPPEGREGLWRDLVALCHRQEAPQVPRPPVQRFEHGGHQAAVGKFDRSEVDQRVPAPEFINQGLSTVRHPSLRGRALRPLAGRLGLAIGEMVFIWGVITVYSRLMAFAGWVIG